MPLSKVDFKIFSDPKKAVEKGETHKGEMVSTVKSLSYLGYLSNFLDWQASMDEASGDETKKKYARYKRLDAAKTRRHINALLTKADESEVPF